jgi:alkane 1-monooxygenase
MSIDVAVTAGSFRRHRWLWLASVASPAVPALAAAALLASGGAWLAAAPLLWYFVAVPILDAIVGEDDRNPTPAELDAMESDPFYRMLLFATLPVYWASLLLCALAAAQPAASWPAILGLALSAGVSSGSALVVAHELGHKTSRAEWWGARAAALLTGYAHFMIEHNRGHHVHVATPEDPASSRLGESVWRFALREIPGAARRGWSEQAALMARRGQSRWSWRNDVLVGYGLATLIAAALILVFGPVMLVFLAVHHVAGWLQLTFANYVEHYGLCRTRKGEGRYEPVTPRHSWNTNHLVSNLMLFHLQRHSDHHAHPLRPYQTLRNFPDLPRLPSGYPGCFVLAALPPLWFAVMDRKVIAWAGSDLSRMNLMPGKEAYYQKLAGNRGLAPAGT